MFLSVNDTGTPVNINTLSTQNNWCATQVAAETPESAIPSDACCDGYSEASGSCVCGDVACTTPSAGIGSWILIIVIILMITGIAASVATRRLRGKSRSRTRLPATQAKHRKKKK